MGNGTPLPVSSNDESSFTGRWEGNRPNTPGSELQATTRILSPRDTR
jgi:hypothetical protein